MAETSKILMALGTFATAMAAGQTAEASVVVTTYDTTVGLSQGGGFGDVSFNLPGSSLSLGGSTYFYSTSDNNRSLYLNVGRGTHVKSARKSGDYAGPATAAPGQTYLDVSGNPRSSVGVPFVFVGEGVLVTDVLPSSGTTYYVFSFTPGGGGTDYGWFSLSDPSYVDVSNFSVKLDQVAYDTSGAPLAVPAAAMPEPASLGLLAWGAMIAGAPAMRRFRRARRLAA